MGAARRCFVSNSAKTTVCTAAPARLSVGTQGTAPLCSTHTQTIKPHPFQLLGAQKSFLLPGEKLEQHCNSCLKHFFPAYSVIPLKAHAFHFPTNHRWEHLAFSSFIFSSLFSPKVSRPVFLSVSVADPHGRGALPPGEPGRVTPAPPSPELQAEEAAGPVKARTS